MSSESMTVPASYQRILKLKTVQNKMKGKNNFADDEREQALYDLVYGLAYNLNGDANKTHRIMEEAISLNLKFKTQLPDEKFKEKFDAALVDGDTARQTDNKRNYSITEKKVGSVSTDHRVDIEIHDSSKVFDISERAFKVLMQKNNPPFIFVRKNKLICLDSDRETNAPIIRNVSRDILSGYYNRICQFITFKKNGEKIETLPVIPPMNVVIDTLEMNAFENTPILKGITTCPIIDWDGGIQEEKGYNREFMLYYEPIGQCQLIIPERPTTVDVYYAVEHLKYLIDEFPFTDDSSKTNLLGLFISCTTRSLLNGKTYPMAIITKPIQGAGASYLCRIANILLTGRDAEFLASPKDAEGFKKILLSSAMKGVDSMMFDNLSGTLYLPELAQAITATCVNDRILGESTMASIDFTPVWVGNGINVTLSGDMPRRCFVIDLQPNSDQPWLKTEYKISNIIEHVKERRGEYLSSLLTLVRYWLQNNMRRQEPEVPHIGTFEEWECAVGGVLAHTEYGRLFLGNLKTMYLEMDTGVEQWSDFLTVWYQTWRFSSIKVSDIVDEIETVKSDLGSNLPDEITNAMLNGKQLQRAIGKAFGVHKNRIYKIVACPSGSTTYVEMYVKLSNNKSNNIRSWQLVEVSPAKEELKK
jgi:hypothetical protein